jgi:hypothetical protein
MPTRRVWRYKARVAPLTSAEWAFFLAKDLAALERLSETAGEQFFWLYYADGWRDCYAEHREEIDAEWRRGWTAKKKAL